MIRAFDNRGVLIIGMSRKLVEELLVSPQGCASEPQSDEDFPIVVRLYLGETDEQVLEKMTEDYGGRAPKSVIDKRTKRS